MIKLYGFEDTFLEVVGRDMKAILGFVLGWAGVAQGAVRVEVYRGGEIAPYCDDLVRICTEVYREYPYLYEYADGDGYKDYQYAYAETDEAIACLAFDGDEVVGAATGKPLKECMNYFGDIFAGQRDKGEGYFYLGELVLLPGYRRQGIGNELYSNFEQAVRSLDSYAGITLCQSEDHRYDAYKPEDYVPNDGLWEKFGFLHRPEVHFTGSWLNSILGEQTPFDLVFWTKQLDEEKVMPQEKISLGSDNYSAVHPEVMEAILEANKGYAPAYGLDVWTAEAARLIQGVFQKDAKVLITPNGTSSNVLSLKIACRPYESVICSHMAHMLYQECGAPESIVGCKLLPVAAPNGKVTCSSVLERLQSERAFGKHTTSPRVLSLTQPTEVGTVYTLDELRDLASLCKRENLLLHIDGSRLYNAAVSLNVSLEAIISAASVDILSLGGTKNGLMGAEALVIFNPDLHEGADHIHKQTLSLMSKMRYLSAQYIPFFEKGIWKQMANHANEKAREIAKVIEQVPGLNLSYPVETNQIFFTAPAEWIAKIQEKITCLLWLKDKNEIRMIASWTTTDEDVEAVRQVLESLN